MRTIDSFADVKGGKRLPKGEQLVHFDTGYPYIRAGNLKNGTVTGEILFLPSELQNAIASYRVATGDVYITIVGACIGDVGIVPPEFHRANLTENAARITIRDNENVDNRFLYCPARAESAGQASSSFLLCWRGRNFGLFSPCPGGALLTFETYTCSAKQSPRRRPYDTVRSSNRPLSQKELAPCPLEESGSAHRLSPT